MKNCFTEAIAHLNQNYKLPAGWKKWNTLDREVFVKNQNKFLARKDHINFFKSFCDEVKSAKADDVVLWDSGVGICINRFFYWTYDHSQQKVVTRKLDREHILMRLTYE
tara:strand:+ start:8164 stop:8490 length:327 start_codon:yes stop_codon:yes gene_type:complete